MKNIYKDEIYEIYTNKHYRWMVEINFDNKKPDITLIKENIIKEKNLITFLVIQSNK